jgi:hypothetical protein
MPSLGCGKSWHECRQSLWTVRIFRQRHKVLLPKWHKLSTRLLLMLLLSVLLINRQRHTLLLLSSMLPLLVLLIYRQRHSLIYRLLLLLPLSVFLICRQRHTLLLLPLSQSSSSTGSDTNCMTPTLEKSKAACTGTQAQQAQVKTVKQAASPRV